MRAHNKKILTSLQSTIRKNIVMKKILTITLLTFSTYNIAMEFEDPIATSYYNDKRPAKIIQCVDFKDGKYPVCVGLSESKYSGNEKKIVTTYAERIIPHGDQWKTSQKYRKNTNKEFKRKVCKILDSKGIIYKKAFFWKYLLAPLYFPSNGYSVDFHGFHQSWHTMQYPLVWGTDLGAHGWFQEMKNQVKDNDITETNNNIVIEHIEPEGNYIQKF